MEKEIVEKKYYFFKPNRDLNQTFIQEYKLDGEIILICLIVWLFDKNRDNFTQIWKANYMKNIV